jgi:hypothetical protein
MNIPSRSTSISNTIDLPKTVFSLEYPEEKRNPSNAKSKLILKE